MGKAKNSAETQTKLPHFRVKFEVVRVNWFGAEKEEIRHLINADLIPFFPEEHGTWVSGEIPGTKLKFCGVGESHAHAIADWIKSVVGPEGQFHYTPEYEKHKT